MKHLAAVVLIVLIQGTMLEAAAPKQGEIEASVIKQIENDTAKQFKLGKVKASCNKAPATPKDGDTFACSAMTKGNKKVHFKATISIQDGGKVKVALMATNLLDRGSINELIKKVLPDIQAQVGNNIALKHVDCGGLFIFTNPDDMLIPCKIKTPKTSQKLNAEIHYTKSLITVEVETQKNAQPPQAKTESQAAQNPDAKPKQP